MVKSQANTAVFSLTASSPNTQVIPSSGRRMTVAFKMCLLVTVSILQYLICQHLNLRTWPHPCCFLSFPPSLFSLWVVGWFWLCKCSKEPAPETQHLSKEILYITMCCAFIETALSPCFYYLTYEIGTTSLQGTISLAPAMPLVQRLEILQLTRTSMMASIGATKVHIAYVPSPDESQQLQYTRSQLWSWS